MNEETIEGFLEALELLEIRGYKLGLNRARELIGDAEDKGMLVELIDKEIRKADRKLLDLETLRLMQSISTHHELWYGEKENE